MTNKQEEGETDEFTRKHPGDRWITIVDDSGEPQAIIEIASVCALIHGDSSTEIYIRGRESPLIAPRALFYDLRKLIHV